MLGQKVLATTSLFKLLSDPTRYKILSALFTTPNLCVSEIAEAVGMSQSATSHQLAKLERYGVVSPRREGQTVCYILNDNALTKKLREAVALFD